MTRAEDAKAAQPVDHVCQMAAIPMEADNRLTVSIETGLGTHLLDDYHLRLGAIAKRHR